MSKTEQKDRIKKHPITGGRALLVLSLAFNLLFIGAIVGAGWMRHRTIGHRGGPPKFVIDRLLSDLPESKRSHIHQLLAQHRQGMRTNFSQIERDKQELMAAIGSQILVPARVREISQKLRLDRSRIGEARTALLLDVLAGLSDEERRKIVHSHLFHRLLAFRFRR